MVLVILLLRLIDLLESVLQEGELCGLAHLQVLHRLDQRALHLLVHLGEADGEEVEGVERRVVRSTGNLLDVHKLLLHQEVEFLTRVLLRQHRDFSELRGGG